MPHLNFVSTEAGADAFAANTGYMEYGADNTQTIKSFPFRVDQDGNVSIKTAGSGLSVAEGSNAKQGTAVLSGGTKVVSNTAVTANSRIFLTSQVDGGTPGWLRVSARTAGTSFTITSSSGTDTSTVAYFITEPA